MVSADTRSVIDRAKQIYADRLQAGLEAEHRGRFVAIGTVSGDYFLADTLDAAAWAKHSDRLSHTSRVGHAAALYMGDAGWRAGTSTTSCGR